MAPPNFLQGSLTCRGTILTVFLTPASKHFVKLASLQMPTLHTGSRRKPHDARFSLSQVLQVQESRYPPDYVSASPARFCKGLKVCDGAPGGCPMTKQQYAVITLDSSMRTLPTPAHESSAIMLLQKTRI